MSPPRGSRVANPASWAAKIRFYEGQPLVVIDDNVSGTGLRGSRLQKAGRVALCDAAVGLHDGPLPAVREALAFTANG